MNNIKLDQILYKAHSNGAVGSWQVRVGYSDDDCVIMVVSSCKVLGGKAVDTTTKYTEGKNIGRSNETTPLEQALLEADSKINKKIDNGYVREIPEAGTKATNGLGFIKPMLAQPIDKVKGWEFPVFVQPKYDGHRMLATVQDGKVVLYSRQGKVVDVEHVADTLQAMYRNGHWDGTTLDGEIYLHGETLQKISSLVKKPQPESERLIYHVYDIHSDKCYQDRISLLYKFVTNGPTPGVSMGPTSLAYDEEHLNMLHAEHIGKGYEGTIVRQLGIGYEDGKRSKSLMKKKDFQDEEFLIINVGEGKPNERLKTRVGLYQLEATNGMLFSVIAPGDAQEKHDHAINGHTNIGKKLTVKFFNYTPDGIPFHPVALRVRDDI